MEINKEKEEMEHRMKQALVDRQVMV